MLCATCNKSHRPVGFKGLGFLACKEIKKRAVLRLARKVWRTWKQFVARRKSRRRDGIDVEGKRDR